MKTILFSLALGALFFAGCLRVVETRAEAVPVVVEAPREFFVPGIEGPAEPLVFEVEEPIETHVVSRVDPAWRKKKPVQIRKQELDYSTFSRYQPLGKRAAPAAPDYSRFSRAMPPQAAPARID